MSDGEEKKKRASLWAKVNRRLARQAGSLDELEYLVSELLKFEGQGLKKVDTLKDILAAIEDFRNTVNLPPSDKYMPGTFEEMSKRLEEILGMASHSEGAGASSTLKMQDGSLDTKLEDIIKEAENFDFDGIDNFTNSRNGDKHDD